MGSFCPFWTLNICPRPLLCFRHKPQGDLTSSPCLPPSQAYFLNIRSNPTAKSYFPLLRSISGFRMRSSPLEVGFTVCYYLHNSCPLCAWGGKKSPKCLLPNFYAMESLLHPLPPRVRKWHLLCDLILIFSDVLSLFYRNARAAAMSRGHTRGCAGCAPGAGPREVLTLTSTARPGSELHLQAQEYGLVSRTPPTTHRGCLT